VRQITYAGPRALSRAQLAADVVRDRLIRLHGLAEDAIDVEYIGAGAAFRGWAARQEPLEVRLRVSAHLPNEEAATSPCARAAAHTPGDPPHHPEPGATSMAFAVT
jgi:hypothetical protein